MDDAELQRELTDALSVAPSPDFVARVRMKIAQQEAPPMLIGWRVPALVTVSIAAIAIAISVRHDAIEPVRGVPFLASRPIGTVVRTPAVVPAATLDSITGSDAIKAIRSKPNAMPEVLIAQDNRQGLIQLLDGLRERRFEATFDQTPPSTPWMMSELAVTPLTIEPLAPPTANN